MSATSATSLMASARDRVKYLSPVPSDINISQALTALPISAIAADAGILPEELDPYGSDKAKVHLSVRDRLKDQKDGALTGGSVSCRAELLVESVNRRTCD
jgi:hypothetical protein